MRVFTKRDCGSSCEEHFEKYGTGFAGAKSQRSNPTRGRSWTSVDQRRIELFLDVL